MTSITKNLPPFIRDLGISIIGKECYVSLVENLELSDTKCLKYALSKGLGIGIVVGGSIMKVPQILLIFNARSARGIALPAYILETLSYAITLAYSYRNNYPFSTYGENLFLTLQNIIIIFLIVIYAPGSRLTTTTTNNRVQKLATTAVATAVSLASLSAIPEGYLALLQTATLPLSVFSKLPQIRQNARAQSTGQLSAVAVSPRSQAASPVSSPPPRRSTTGSFPPVSHSPWSSTSFSASRCTLTGRGQRNRLTNSDPSTAACRR